MTVLPFQNLPIIPDLVAPNLERRDKLLKSTSPSSALYSLLFEAFMAYEGKFLQNYPNDLLYPIGYKHHGTIVTSKKVIIEMSKKIPDDPDLRAHLEQYFDLIEEFPPWETQLYQDMVSEGKTPRILDGPHKFAGLKTGQKRKVIIADNGELILGPFVAK